MCPTGDALIYTSPYTGPESSTVETSPVVSGNTVFATASDGIIYAIELATGKLRWRYHLWCAHTELAHPLGQYAYRK